MGGTYFLIMWIRDWRFEINTELHIVGSIGSLSDNYLSREFGSIEN